MKTIAKRLLVVAAAIVSMSLFSGCTTAPKFRSLAGTDSYYRVLAGGQLFHADAVSVHGDWVVVEAWTENLAKRPASPATKTVWIPRDTITSIQMVKGSD
jgi:hypothetical protein